MLTIPTLTTPRLILRPYTLDDVARLQPIANDNRIAVNIPFPYPYSTADAEKFINSIADEAQNDRGFSLAITLTQTSDLMGSIGFHLDAKNCRASFGYWIGVAFWGNGYTTEAAEALVDYLFTTLNLHRITAAHYGNNPASGRVMQKLGMTHEGASRQHIRQNDAFVDDIHYGLLRDQRLERRQKNL